MKPSLLGKTATIIAFCFTGFTHHLPSNASTFEQQEVNQDDLIAIARPYGDNKYDLLIIRQIPGQQKCWSESGANPILVNPLLLNFDFTGSCERSTDSNGYSIRIDGQDYGLDYLLRIIKHDGELILVGTNRNDLSQSEIIVGRSNGIANGFMRLELEPGWRFTKRTYNGRVLGHVYLTGDSSTIEEQSLLIATSSSSPKQETQDSRPMREMTFTADNQPDSKTSAAFKPLSSVSISQKSFSSPVSPTTMPSSSALPPPPQPRSLSTITEPLPKFSDLPPLALPPQNNSNSIVPPPQSSTSTDLERKGLSNVGGFLSNPTPVVRRTSLKGYRVIVATNTNHQKVKVRSLYPEAFPTSHNGKSVWQVGLFSERDNAEEVHRTLENAGLKPTIIP
ncbi:MAG: DUF3747 domain-containing protein [cyanobacterium endosymbiont of Rhopalodia musculus]|uniref:DUF3747 domain-containing protein n=1 Tax=cyanobacterium endosymbiont of Epithemia clementina EcSB TaxID=3034674 RepID=UPI00248028DB|nr:DUF3747 domain-containing protein [cyanobacterium endosymbiont of Epithemia clementina EcSB]WGT68388.1 DUF3747 domain-containing protein [cyanobacterium endosymbiont of Epithemia clementina EcSB]